MVLERLIAAGVAAFFFLIVGCPELDASELNSPSSELDGGIPPDCVPTVPSEQPPEPPPMEPTGISVNFTDPADRAELTEDGLEYVARKGNFAVYRVTSESARIYIPGTIPARARTMHRTALCVGHLYFTDEIPEMSAKIQLRGIVDGEDKLLERRGLIASDFGSCAGPIDIRGGTDGDDQIEDLYLTLDPVPSVGSLVPLMMVAIGFDDGDVPHMNDDIRISCNELGACNWEQDIVATCPEPPDPSDPPGGDEPPDPSDPPDGGEPPDPSDPPECPPGYEPIDPSQPGTEPPGASQPGMNVE